VSNWTSLGVLYAMRKLAAGESPPNPKVQYVHYDTGPRATGNRRTCGCCGALEKKATGASEIASIAHPGRTVLSAPGTISAILRQLNQRSHRIIVENISGVEAYARGVPYIHTKCMCRGPEPKRIVAGGRIYSVSVSTQDSRLQTFPRGSDEPKLWLPC